MSLPIAWVLKDKPVLLVGGGEVAETRIRKLVPNEAKVVIVAPEISSYIQKLVNSEQVRWMQRGFEAADLEMEHWSFVLTAIDDHKMSREIARLCRAKHIPVNVADVIPLCDFYFGANFEQGPLKVMVSTGSGAPRLAKRVLNELASHASRFQFGEAITNVQKLRQILRDQLPGDDPKISSTRMALMRTLCDKLSFPELAALKDGEMAPMIRGMVLSTAACPAHPIGDVSNASDFVELPKQVSSPESSESSDESQSSENEGSDEESQSSEHEGNGGRVGMKRTAVECAEGHPPPKLPSFPFKA